MANETTRLAVLIEANTKSYERAMARMETRTSQAMRRSSTSVTTLDRQMKGLAITAGKAFATFGIGVGAIGFGALASSIGEVVREADKLTKVADKVGLTTDELQELRYAGELTGVAINQTDIAMQRFSRRLAEAAAGGGVLAPILEANNIQLRKADGTLRSSREVLGDYADLVKNATSNQDQLRLAFLAFDTEGAALVNTLREGKDGLQGAADEAHRLSVILDEELAREAAELNDEWTKFTAQMTTGWQTFVLETVGGIKEVTDALGGMINLMKVLSFAVNPAEAGRVLGQQIGMRLPGAVQQDYLPPLVRPTLPDNPYAGSRHDGEFGPTGKKTIIPPTGSGRRDESEAAERVARLHRQAAEAIELQVEAYDDLRDASRDVLGGIVADLQAGAKAGEVLSNVLNKIVSQLANSAIDSLITALLGQPGTLGTGLIGGLLFGGARAAGGPVMSGRSYLVGEKGPELFTPKVSGAISPNGAGGSPIVFNTTVNAPNSTKDSVAALAAELNRRDRRLAQQIPQLVRRAQMDRQI